MSQTYPTARIEGLYLSTAAEDFLTQPVDTLNFELDPNGIAGAVRHGGNTTLADVRTPSYWKRRDTVLNRQAVSFIGSEDMDYIAEGLDLNPDIIIAGCGYGENDDPSHITRDFLARCLGANVLVKDFSPIDLVPAFRSILPGTDFGPYDPDTRKFTHATVMVTRVNGPCISPGKKIQAAYPLDVPDMAQRFVRVAQGRRGFVGMVAKGGQMSVGQTVSFVPFGM